MSGAAPSGGGGGRAATFDVFDTVLTRATGSPASAFLLLGRRAREEGLVPAGVDAAAFREARAGAERVARAWAPGGECTLAQVHAELAFALGLPAGAAERLAGLELELERRLLRPVPSGVERVRAARARGERVAFVSDTYFPRAFVEGLLREHGVAGPGEPVLVSCEHGASKHGGALFPVALAALGAGPGDAVHTGDNAHADVAMARRRGLRAGRFTDALPTPAEAAMEAHAGATGGLASLFAGAARAARLGLAGAVPAGRERWLAEAGAQYAGPVLGAYCLWFLGRARARGLRRLYLLSRDGEVLIEVCRALMGRLGWDLELRYLYASRQGWHLPGIVSLGARHRSWLLEKTDSSTVRRMLSRVEIRPEDFAGALGRHGLPAPSWDRYATTPLVRALEGALGEPELKGAIEARAAERRAVVLDYLRQEGMLDGTPSAIVDVGWHGRLQHSLASILATAGAEPPAGFYMGLRGDRVEPGVGDMEAYLFDARRRAGRRFPTYEYDAMTEVFCSATHGTLRGYAREGGRVAPVLKEARNEGALGWGLGRFREGVRAFAAALPGPGEIPGAPGPGEADLRPMVWDVLETLIERPRREDALALAPFPFDTDQSGETHIPLGRRLGVADAWAALVPRGRVFRPWAFWRAGSMALSGGPARALVGGAARANALASKAARRVRARVRPAPAAAPSPAVDPA